MFDGGPLITRAYKSTVPQDYSGCIFVKTIFHRIFRAAGIKTDGELFDDPIFQTLLLSRQNVGQDELQARSSYAAKVSGNQLMVIGITNTDLVTFEDDSNFPYYDGSKNNYDPILSRFTADVKMRVKVNISVNVTLSSAPGIGHTVSLAKNGILLTDIIDSRFLFYPISGDAIVSFESIVDLNAGDYLNVVGTATAPTVDYSYNVGSVFKVTPTYIFFSAGNSLVPAWTKQQLISNVLSLFCVVSDYNPYTKTITFNLFEKIKEKEAIDLSESLTIDETDYEEFIGNFFQKSQLKYEESNDEDIEGYNNARLVKYGAGQIIIDNKTIEESGTILDSEFKAPVSYVNGAFAASLERTNFIDLQENGNQDFTSVTQLGDVAKFMVADETIYTLADVVRVSDSTNLSYNGDYVINQIGTGYIMLLGAFFLTDSSGIITKLEYHIGSDDGVYLFINTKYRLDNVEQYSTHITQYLMFGQYGNFAYPFFNILNTGRPINESYKQGLSFGSVDNPLSYQRSLIDKYWPMVGRVLNDPVKLNCTGYISTLLYGKITPLRPVRVKTEITNNLYYCNSITGYKGSSEPCEVQLIKLS